MKVCTMGIEGMTCVSLIESTHGRSKRSGWSGFGRTTFYRHFWNCACADNEIFALAQLHQAITSARTTPWLQRMNDQDPRKATSTVNFKFSKRTFEQKKAVSITSNLLGLASGSGNDFTSWLSAR